MSEVQSVVFLKGRKVSLRPMEKTDLPNCARWINDPEIRDFVSAYWPMTAVDEEKWFENISKDRPNNLVLAIVAGDNKHIGTMAIHNINWRDRVGTTGALIGEKEFWGKGFGTEAKILLLHHAFQTMNLHKICSQVIAYNERSVAYSKKCGYKEDGIFKQHTFRSGQYWDVVNLAVFWEDFRLVWEKYQAESI